MSTIHTNHSDVKKIALAAFPNYTGRKFCVTVVTHPINVCSYWSGGSRTYFNFVNLTTGKCYGEIPQQSAFDEPIQNADRVNLIPNLACVAHKIFCGKDLGIEIMIHPDNAPALLTNNTVEITEQEKIVLLYTKRLKSSYNGISNYRFYEAHKEKGISKEQWETAKQSLIEKKLLTKSGAITSNGRNLVS